MEEVKPKRRTCRCTAALNAEGICPFKCPPAVKRQVQKSTREPYRERGFNWRRDAKGVRVGSWKEQRDAEIAAKANRH